MMHITTILCKSVAMNLALSYRVFWSPLSLSLSFHSFSFIFHLEFFYRRVHNTFLILPHSKELFKSGAQTHLWSFTLVSRLTIWMMQPRSIVESDHIESYYNHWNVFNQILCSIFRSQVLFPVYSVIWRNV